LVYSSPQIVLFAFYLHEYLIYIERITVALVFSTEPSGEFGSEFRAPKPDAFIAYSDAPLGEQILNISVTEIESVVEPNGVADDFGRESVAFVSVHPQIIDHWPLTCQYPRDA
jgi:hypothetical protein